MTALTPPAIAAVLEGLIRAPHPVLTRLGAEARDHGVPVTDALTGALLHGLARAIGATKVLEIGTGLGASAIWMATALPSTGLLVTLERDHARATTARAAIAEAGLDDRVNVMIGEADRYLHKIAGPFDLVVQDGDAALVAPMLDKLDRLLRPGGTLVTPRALAAPGGFADRLSADARFTTHWLPLGEGLAVSVKHA
ncbi:MAG: class I SAM-dependent methyltransferase [Vicinamibacterales bacterium]